MKKIKFVIPLMLAFMLVIGCASETPWRKAAVTTYELLGIGIGATKDTAESLKAQNLITDEQIAKIKDVYTKARNVYIAAGNSLKLAGKAESALGRDQFLVEYDKLLADFRSLSYQLYDLLKDFKKVSYNDVLEMIKNGGEV